MTQIHVRDCTVQLDTQSVIKTLDLAVEDGEWLAVIGPNGAGKSTLLRAIAGVVPYSGSIKLSGSEVASLHVRDRAKLLAFMPQQPLYSQQMSVLDYVLLGRTPHSSYLARTTAEDTAAAEGVLQRVELGHLARRHMGTLSGGERQRAHLAQTLVQRAPVVLLDEPTTSLDIGHAQQVLELFDTLRRESGATVVTSLHDLNSAALYADRVALMADGHLVALGAPVEVLTADAIHEHYGADVAVTVADGRPTITVQRATRNS